MTLMSRVHVSTLALAGGLLLACTGAATPQDKPLRVMFAGAVNNVPMMVAAENGYWIDLGLDVSVQVLESGSQIARAVQSGAVDIGAGAATSAIPLSRAAGNLMTFVAPYHNNPLVVNGVERVALIASKKSGVTTDNPKGLAGKSIGVAVGSTSESYLRGYLGKIGLAMTDVRMVNVAVADMSAALQQGSLDAVVPWEPYVSEIIRTQGGKTQVVSRGGPFGASVVGIMVADAYMQANRETLEKYVIGAWKGVKFARENPEKAAALAQRYIQGVNPTDAASAISVMKAEFDPRISVCTEAAILQEQRALIASGNMKSAQPLAYDAIVQVDFINGLLAKHPELLEGLPPLPTSVDQCGGR